MTCSGLEFLYRPYPYAREPFRIASGELVAYEGRYFSIPAFGLMLDKRLFTNAASHPVATDITLYINKDAGLSESIEARLDASGYQNATPHYADYILDLRTLLEEVVVLHGNDSDHSSNDFFISHMQRNRASYDLNNTSASGVSDLKYIHPAPQGTVPIAPSSTTVPATGIELGALQFQDIDMDEIMWQPFPRPKSRAVGTNDIPLYPIFPMAIPSNGLPEFSSYDEERFGALGLNFAASGGVIVTGDALVEGTAIKLMTGSGEIGAAEGDYIENVPWARFPAGTELNRYYETESSGCINASGRQAIYDTPVGLSDGTVRMLNVAYAGGSGYVVQNFPPNYHGTSGVDKNGIGHHGVHITSKLLYNLSEFGTSQIAVGRSPINGKKIFGHYVGTETSSKGYTITGRTKYVNGNTLHVFGGITKAGSIADPVHSEHEWGTCGKTFSPINWNIYSTTAFAPTPILFGNGYTVTWTVGDIMAADDGVFWTKPYAGWGTMNFVVYPGQDDAGGGERVTETINYETHIYKEGSTPGTWVELDPPESPSYSSENVTYYRNTYSANNIFALFFYKHNTFGLVNVNGNTYIQWSDTGLLPRYNKFAVVSQASRSTKIYPLTNRSVATWTIGFFPNWALRMSVTTNNQISLPDKMSISPASSTSITFDSSLPMTTSDVAAFGPATWDSAEGVNYIYFGTNDGRYFFAKMDTSFKIIYFNRVALTDAITNGRMAIIDI